MNHKIFLLLLINLFSLISMAQKQIRPEKFELNGIIKGRNTGRIALMYWGRNNHQIIDTAILKNGKFSFSGFIKEPTLATLKGNVQSRSMDDPNYTVLFLEPSVISISLMENNYQHAQIKGSFTQDEFEKLNKQKEPIRSEIKSLVELRSGLNHQTLSKEIKNKLDSIEFVFKSCYRSLKMIDYKFVRLHPESFLSPYLLSGYKNDDIPLDSAKHFYSKFSTEVKNSFWGKNVLSQIQSEELSVLGSIAFKFIAPDIYGKKIELSSFENKKVVLLDFWWSGCIPCREMNPYLISLNKKFHAQGLEIISVSSDVDKTAWKNAIIKDGIGDWAHIQNVVRRNNAIDQPNISSKYSVSVYPTYILIDKGGVMEWRHEGSIMGDNLRAELEEKIHELIK